MTHPLWDEVRQAGAQLTRDFEIASARGRGSPSEVADFREGALRQVLGRFFTSRERVVKGKIFDSFGGVSASVDCVVLGPNHPNLVDDEGKFNLILADGVSAAIEVKTDLRDRRELTRAVAQCQSVKRLRRTDVVGRFLKSAIKDPDELRRREEVLESSRQLLSVIFATSADSSPQDTAVAFEAAHQWEWQVGDVYERAGNGALL